MKIFPCSLPNQNIVAHLNYQILQERLMRYIVPIEGPFLLWHKADAARPLESYKGALRNA